MDAYHYIANELARRRRCNEEYEHIHCRLDDWDFFISYTGGYAEFRSHEGTEHEGWWPYITPEDVVKQMGKDVKDVTVDDYYDLSFDFIGGKTIRQVLMERDEEDVWFDPE